METCENVLMGICNLWYEKQFSSWFGVLGPYCSFYFLYFCKGQYVVALPVAWWCWICTVFQICSWVTLISPELSLLFSVQSLSSIHQHLKGISPLKLWSRFLPNFICKGRTNNTDFFVPITLEFLLPLNYNGKNEKSFRG